MRLRTSRNSVRNSVAYQNSCTVMQIVTVLLVWKPSWKFYIAKNLLFLIRKVCTFLCCAFSLVALTAIFSFTNQKSSLNTWDKWNEISRVLFWFIGNVRDKILHDHNSDTNNIWEGGWVRSSIPLTSKMELIVTKVSGS